MLLLAGRIFRVQNERRATSKMVELRQENQYPKLLEELPDRSAYTATDYPKRHEGNRTPGYTKPNVIK